MAEYGLYAAALLAVIPAMMGSRTAAALLCSLLYAKGLDALAVPFWLPLWLLADLAVLAVILGPNMTLQDELVAALFIPAWWAYFTDPVTLYEITLFIVVMQLLIVLPWPKFQGTSGSVSHGSLKGKACGGL